MKEIKFNSEDNKSFIILNKLKPNKFKFKKYLNIECDIKIKLILLLTFIIIYLIIIIKNNKIKIFNLHFKKKYNLTFEYHNFERELITEKMINHSDWQLLYNEPYFINGIIRKYKPKKCLEIGVAYGGSTIIILNAIKDIKDSFLVSLDLFTNLYCDTKLKTGCRVNEYFPELTKKWKLMTGEQPHKFLDKLNIKFDFLLLDTMHQTPGELSYYIF